MRNNGFHDRLNALPYLAWNPLHLLELNPKNSVRHQSEGAVAGLGDAVSTA